MLPVQELVLVLFIISLCCPVMTMMVGAVGGRLFPDCRREDGDAVGHLHT